MLSDRVSSMSKEFTNAYKSSKDDVTCYAQSSAAAPSTRLAVDEQGSPQEEL